MYNTSFQKQFLNHVDSSFEELLEKNFGTNSNFEQLGTNSNFEQIDQQQFETGEYFDADSYLNNLDLENIDDLFEINAQQQYQQVYQQLQNQQQQKQFNQNQNGNQKNNSVGVKVKNDRTKIQQKQYRKRQKEKLQDIEQQIQQLTQKYETLKKEQEGLKERHDILSEMVQNQHQNLEKSQELCSNNSNTEQIFDDEFSDRPMQVILKNFPQIRWFSNFYVPFESEVFQRQFSQKQFRELTVDELTTYHGGFVSLISSHLNEIKNGDKNAEKNLKKIAFEMARFIMRVLVSNPRLIRAWGMYHPHAIPPDFSSWVQVIKQLGLTEIQMKKMTQLRCFLFEQFVKFCQKIKRCGVFLESNNLRDFCEVTASQQYIERHRAFKQLIEIVKNIEMAIMRFSMTIRMRVMTFMQNAKFIVAAYPQGPDFVALTHCAFYLLKQKQNNCVEAVQQVDNEGKKNKDIEESLVNEVQQMRQFLGLQNFPKQK